MKHPYKNYEKTKEWQLLLTLIKDLIANGDIELFTPIEYVVGYICKGVNKNLIIRRKSESVKSYRTQKKHLNIKKKCTKKG